MMNGAAGFQEVESSTSRLPSSRFPHEQWHQFGTVRGLSGSSGLSRLSGSTKYTRQTRQTK
jgi:hypothetical protein